MNRLTDIDVIAARKAGNDAAKSVGSAVTGAAETVADFVVEDAVPALQTGAQQAWLGAKVVGSAVAGFFGAMLPSAKVAPQPKAKRRGRKAK